MSATLDYASLYEAEFRNRTLLRRTLVVMVAAGLFVVRPGLTLRILRESRVA